MRARTLTTSLAAAAVAVMALTGLTACSSTAGGQPVASDANVSGVPLDAATEMDALCKQMITEALPVEAAQALAEANGYVTRVGSIDGTPQAATTDLREDRFTFDVKDGVVTGCTVG